MRTNPTVIRDAGEEPLVLFSQVEDSIEGLELLERGLLFAELAMIAYNDQAEAGRAAAAIGFPETDLYDRDGAQAYRFGNSTDVVLACRGTEPTEWNDLKADANAALAVVGAVGKVHSGFKREVDDLWPELEDHLRKERRPIWFCGHSLGAAMATICAYRCKDSTVANDPRELHTFGSPRVGCRRFAKHVHVKHYRWVNNNDIVTRVPPAWMGYRHAGRELYFNRKGRLSKLTGVWRSRDRWKGLLNGFWEARFDWLADHSVRDYARQIARELAESNGQTFDPGPS